MIINLYPKQKQKSGTGLNLNTKHYGSRYVSTEKNLC